MNFWQLLDFENCLDRWISVDEPSVDLRFVVTEWALSCGDDPYRNVRRRTDVGANYWFGIVPGSRNLDSAVVCGIWIDEQSRSVRCDTIATLALPL